MVPGHVLLNTASCLKSLKRELSMTGTGVHLLQAAANERYALPRGQEEDEESFIDGRGSAHLKTNH